MPTTAGLVSIVVPVYNEEANIEPFYARLSEVMGRLDMAWEMVSVNDGSTDGTLQRLLSLRNHDRRIRIINLSRNFGKEIALTAGLDHSAGDAVIPMDADLQDPPELIPALIAKWREGYEVVLARRTNRRGEPWLKRLTAFAFYRIIRRITRVDIPPDTGDFRLMSRRVVEMLRRLRERHRFMKGLFAWVGFQYASVPYERAGRGGGASSWSYWRLWNFAVDGITSFSHTPLKAATLLGFVVAVGAFIYAAYMVVRTVLFGNPVPGYPSLLVFILFLGGVQLITIGIIGEYLGRVSDEVKQRPLYIVDKVYEEGSSSAEGEEPKRRAPA